MSEDSQFPRAWAAVSMRDVGSLYCGTSPTVAEVNDRGVGTPYVTGPEHWDGTTLKVNKWTTAPRRVVPDGCIFITVKGAGVGKLFPGVACAIGRDVYAFKPAGVLLPKFVEHSLRFHIQQIVQHAKGDIPGLSKDHILDHLIGVPPQAEQKRIVARLEELFSDLDAGVAALDRVRAKLKRYRASVLYAAVTGKLTEAWRQQNPSAEPADKLLVRILDERRKRWEVEQLRKFTEARRTPPKGWKEKYEEPPHRSESRVLPDLWRWTTIDQVTSGDRTSAYGVLQPGDDLEGGVPLVRVCDVVEGNVIVDQLKRIDPAISTQFKRTILRGGEVLLTIVGTIGRTAIAPDSIRGANTARAVAVIPTTTLLPSRFIEMALRENSMRSRLTAASHEVARKTLNLEDVRVAVLPLPSVAEQHEIIAEVERRLSVVAAIEADIDHGLKRAARLRQAILRRAFEGKLVPQIEDGRAEVLTIQRAPAVGGRRGRVPRAVTPTRRKRTHRKGIVFDRGAVMSYVVKRLSGSPNFGRTEAMKVLYLGEAWLGIDLELEPVREKLGPLDEAIYKVESLARKQEWFTTKKSGQMVHYVAGPALVNRLGAAKHLIGDKLPEFDRLLGAIEKMETEQAELFATAFAVWNDLLLDEKKVSDEAIIAGVHGWHPSKRSKFPADRIVQCLRWMERQKFVPEGKGPRSVLLAA